MPVQGDEIAQNGGRVFATLALRGVSDDQAEATSGERYFHVPTNAG